MPAWFSQFRTMLGSVSSGPRNAPNGGQGNLQAINPNSDWIPPDARETLEARRYACVCSIVVDGSGHGSGFLIAEDLVMTNYHVVFDKVANKFFEPGRIKCRFNFFDDDQYENDEYEWIALLSDDKAFAAYSPTAQGDWDLTLDEHDYLDPVTQTPLLDYAILRLNSPVGKRAGQTSLNLQVDPLGWIAMDDAPRIGQKLSVFQFPKRVGTGVGFTQQPLRTSDSTLVKVVAGGLRAKYDASTSQGSSGSPVFDGTTLVGLHNAGEEEAKTADNRFIPIDCILKDLARRSPELHTQLVSTRPPSIAAQQRDPTARLSEPDKLAVGERVKAAEALLDREKQNDLIQAKLRGRDPAAVHVNHVVCREKDDEVDGFLQRIRVGVAQAEALVPTKFIEQFLRGSNLTEGSAWGSAGMTWPDPNTPPDEARDLFRNALGNNRYASRTLVVLQTASLAKRSREEEYTYMKILGEECADYVKARNVDPANAWRELQTLVVYRVPAATKIDLAPIVPLWTNSPPPHCGASFALPKVKQDHFEPWRVNINEAWKKSNTPIKFPTAFDPDAEFYMAEVVAMLRGPITTAAIALLERGGNTA